MSALAGTLIAPNAVVRGDHKREELVGVMSASESVSSCVQGLGFRDRTPRPTWEGVLGAPHSPVVRGSRRCGERFVQNPPEMRYPKSPKIKYLH